MSGKREIKLSGIFSEGYGVIPKRLMRSRDLSITDKAVMAYLLSYTGGGSECYPSLRTISGDLGISQRTVIRTISKAIHKGYLAKRREHKGKGIGSFNVYTLLFMPHASDTRGKSKGLAGDKCDTLQVTPGKRNNNNEYIRARAKKQSIYPDLKRMDDDD